MPTWPNGYGETLGDILTTGEGLKTSGVTRFIHYTDGADANDGLDPESPKKTLQAAVTASSARDIVCALDGHEETLTAVMASSLAGLILVGSGLSSGYPTAKFTLNSAGNPKLIDLTGIGVQVRNLWFRTNSVANTSARLEIDAPGALVKGCYFECAGNDDSAGLRLGDPGTSAADYATVEDCTFVSTATSLATRPHSGMRIAFSSAYPRIARCVFDGGTYGFSNAALLFDAASTGIHCEQISLLRGADVNLSTSTGFFQAPTITGGSRVTWAV